MFSAFFVTILISLASGVGLEFSDTIEKLFVRIHNDDIRVEINGSPIPTVVGILTTPTPSPSPTLSGTSPAHAGPTSVKENCDFEYHKTNNGEPIDFDYNCTEETKGGGLASTSVNIEANSSGSGNVSNSVDVSVSTN